MKNTTIKKNPEKPVEKHDTAAWSDVQEVIPVSRVSLPTEKGVVNAKEWVDENQK